VAEAVRRGYGYVELRQGCLGAYERKSDGGTTPDPGAMTRLPERFPKVGFNLALAVPFFSGRIGPDDPLFRAGVEASRALALGGVRAAHLRLVDPETPADTLSPASADPLAERLSELASVCGARGGILSVENARQPWALLHRIFEQARALLGPRASALQLCYD